MMSTTELLRTPLHDWHVSHGGRMVDFAGWSMPVQYTSIAEEHHATRNAVGVFDISHMGRLLFDGPRIADFLDSVATRRTLDMNAGQVRYALICNDQGGILDDVLIYKLPPASAHSFLMVVNASNREKIVAWLNEHIEAAGKLSDTTCNSSMIAVQGPLALRLVEQVVQMPQPIASMKYYTCGAARFGNDEILISRTGYTGEDGIELIGDAKSARALWQRVVDAALEVGGMAAGLGARDTLRLEAAMPLYGHELGEAINPIQAGLQFAVNRKPEERWFIGSTAIERFAADKSQPVRVGLQVDGKRVARQGCPVLQGNEIIGEVTSGTFSPTFERPIAMAYVRPTAGAIGTRLAVDIRGTQYAATVVPLPFYERSKRS